MLQHTLFRAHSYLCHSFRAFKSKKGYGIHSPFAFCFITDIINPEVHSYYYSFNEIEEVRNKLRLDKRKIMLENGRISTVAQIARTSASPIGDSQLLFRTASSMSSKRIIELGTSLGIGTSYLAKTSNSAKVVTIDHNVEIQSIAKESTRSLKLDNIDFFEGAFEDQLTIALEHFGTVDLVFFDGNHCGDATLSYYNSAKKHTHARSVFVFHDIHWSKDMHKAWLRIVDDKSNTISIECYNLGFIFFDPELNKQHFFA